MIFGIIAAQNCKLTEIGRKLKEPILLKKTVERLGRNLSKMDEKDRKVVTEDYMKVVKGKVDDSAMLLVDGGDATKPCSPKMESIGSVIDGSTGEFANGYWTMGAVALSEKYKQPIPVYENLYPCNKQGGKGSKVETLKCLQSLRENFSNTNVRVFDRGFDDKDIFKDLAANNEKFIIRQSYNSVVVHKGKRVKVDDVVRGLVCTHEMKFESKTGKISNCKIGITQIILPRAGNLKLNLVVCKEFGETPLVLYTNIDEDIETLAVRVVKAYLLRWRIEEYYGFKKEDGLDFEDFRVRTLNAIKNLDLLVTIAIGFLSMLSENIDNIAVIQLILISKRIQKIDAFLKDTKFFLYAVSDGISTLFDSIRSGIYNFFTPIPSDNQIYFDWDKIMG
jgi:hypothetical protein